jgi:sugar/nucleoside kinase (ribokinase family)
VAEYPPPDSKQRLQRFARLPGGEIATALSACARLGWRTRYVGRFGGDHFGALARESLERAGVDVTAAVTIPGATNRFAIILVDARSGERTVLWDRDPALAMQPADIAQEVVTSGRFLLVDAHDTAASRRAARAARAAGIPTVVDVEKVRPGIGELLQQIDVIIAARDFPAALTGHEEPGRAIEAMARETRAALVCVTLGADGSLAWCRGREIRTPAFPIDCIDSTGAGDVFRAGFIAGCLREPHGDLEDALRYANAAAALNCRALGAGGALPTVGEIDELLAMRTER